MTSATTLSRPYAAAVFEIAKSANQLSHWADVLKQLSLITQEKQMQSLLKNPAVTTKQMSEIVLDILHVMDSHTIKNNVAMENFIKILSEKKRLNLLPSIAALFEADYAKELGYLSLTVTSAFALHDAQRKAITEKLSKKLNTEIKIIFLVDEKLIGGLLIRSDTWILDDSIKGRIQKLRTVITE